MSIAPAAIEPSMQATSSPIPSSPLPIKANPTAAGFWFVNSRLSGFFKSILYNVHSIYWNLFELFIDYSIQHCTKFNTLINETVNISNSINILFEYF